MRRHHLLDLAVTVAVMVPTLLTALRPPLHLSYLALGLAASAPVFWRRRAIVPVALVVGCATTGLSLLGPQLPLPYGMLVCTFTFATLDRAWLRAVAVLVTAAAVAGSLRLTGDGLDSFGYVGLAYATAYGLGVGTRARQAELAALRERASRLEADATHRERTRIARDLHDGLAHSLTLVAVQAEAGPVVVRSEPVRAEELFASIGATARHALTQIRRTLTTLREGGPPGGLDDVPELVERARDAGLAATLTRTGPDRPVPPDVGAAAFRIVQESITNTLRHAHARTVHVGLDWSDAGLSVEVVDDGTPAAAPPSPGYGLIGLRERAVACGGTLRAGPEPAGGFAVRAWLPVPA